MIKFEDNIEDRELVKLIYKKINEAHYSRQDKLYVGPEMYNRIRREPYFTQFSVHTGEGKVEFKPFGATIVVVYPDSIEI